MNKKEYYEKIINEKYTGKTKDLLFKSVELFYRNSINIKKNKYNIGEDVSLKKGTFLHGLREGFNGFDWIVDSGFISTDFSEETEKGLNKIKNSVGVWNIKEDMLLKDYINEYSGFTITYTLGRGPEAKKVSELISYHKFDEVTEELNDRDDVYIWWGDKTKEVTYLPSLVANKSQIGFILNMDSDYGKELSYLDVWNTELDEGDIEDFLDYRYYPEFIKLRFNKDASSTDRESAIMFGITPRLIEGVLVGRKIENDKEKLNYIKSKLPDCYICNLDGKVIVENK